MVRSRAGTPNTPEYNADFYSRRQKRWRILAKRLREPHRSLSTVEVCAVELVAAQEAGIVAPLI